MTRFLPIAAVFALLGATAAPPAGAEVFGAETFTLSNGMEAVVISNHRAPIVSHYVWYRAGAADEPPGKSGIAHFLEHLMFKGTDTVPPGEFSRTVARLGGRDNAFTSQDYTAYFQSIARDRLEDVMRLEADRMQNLTLSDEVVLPERDVILEERGRVIESDPSRRLSEEMSAALYVHHPYGTPIIGWRHEMEELTREDALDWYRTWYSPQNAILVVSGDITVEELKPLAEEIYGVIPARDISERVRVAEPQLLSDRRVIVRDENVRQPRLQRRYLAPGGGEEGDRYGYALQLLADILGGGQSSRLYTRLVIDGELASQAWAYHAAPRLDLSEMVFGLDPRGDTAVETLEAALQAEIDLLLAEGVSEDELARAKRRILADAIYARDSVSWPARVIGQALTTGNTVADVEAWPEKIEAVTVEDMTAAIERVFRDKPSVTGLLLPAETTRAATR